MFHLMQKCNNTWTPPRLTESEINDICEKKLPNALEDGGDYFIIYKLEPYIDCIYVHIINGDSVEDAYKKRFVFCEGYAWDYQDERLFIDRILNNNRLWYSYGIDDIFEYYSAKYPDWKLQRYYSKPMRLLDHIYNCMTMGAGKEILYKAGLAELAANIEDLEEINLLSSKPSDIYDGLSIKILRALNCRDGSLLLATGEKRQFIKELQMKFPGIFKEKLNNAQCRYLNYLYEGDLTVGETGRLFQARRMDLMMMWANSQYEMFIYREDMQLQAMKQAEEIVGIDPIYKDYIGKIDLKNAAELGKKIKTLRYYLIAQRKELDIRFRQSNRKRNQNWQERNNGYVVRFPQTINDFCREAVYMSNCLLTYVDAFLENSTTILFMRKTDDFNTPFITMEIFNGELMQAYHRFNEDCTEEEAEWIRTYCKRHEIGHSKFNFNNDIDELF